jgi:hypothetical protein
MVTPEQFNALIDLVDEALLFASERIQRSQSPRADDHGRLTDLHGRLRSLRVSDGPEAA